MEPEPEAEPEPRPEPPEVEAVPDSLADLPDAPEVLDVPDTAEWWLGVGEGSRCGGGTTGGTGAGVDRGRPMLYSCLRTILVSGELD